MLVKNSVTKLLKIANADQMRTLTTNKEKIYYVWVDLELTGLDVEKDKILEITCIITTPELELVHEGISRIIHQPDSVLNSMNDWSMEHHIKSGLVEASRNSKITISHANEEVSNYINQYAKGLKNLAGNSVYMDKMFLTKYMPLVNNLFHHHLLDVTSLKLLCRDWFPAEFSQLPKKKASHRTLDDIMESIEELKYYRKSIFK